MSDLYLALDQGGHASRALLFDWRRHPRCAGGGADRNPARSGGSRRTRSGGAAATRSSRRCRGLRGRCRPAPRIVAAGLATQRSSMVCWDRRTGAALSPVISWQDRRQRGLASISWRPAGRGDPRADRPRADTPLWRQQDALVPRSPAGSPAAPSAGRHSGHGPPRELHCLPSGQQAVPLARGPRECLPDPALGTGHQGLVAGTPGPVRHRRDLLPRAVPSRYAFGDLETPAGPVPLTVVTGDQSAVPFAFGAAGPRPGLREPRHGGVRPATPCRARLPDAPRLLVSVVWSEADRVDYMLEGTVNGAASALDWLAEREGLPLAALLAAAASARWTRARAPRCSSTVCPGSARPSGSATWNRVSSAAGSTGAPGSSRCWKASPSSCRKPGGTAAPSGRHWNACWSRAGCRPTTISAVASEASVACRCSGRRIPRRPPGVLPHSWRAPHRRPGSGRRASSTRRHRTPPWPAATSAGGRRCSRPWRRRGRRRDGRRLVGFPRGLLPRRQVLEHLPD